MKVDYPNSVFFRNVIGQPRHDRRRHDLDDQKVMTLAGVCAQPRSKAVAHLMDTARSLPFTILGLISHRLSAPITALSEMKLTMPVQTPLAQSLMLIDAMHCC